MITLKEYKAGREASIVELSVLGRKLGIDVDVIREKHMNAIFEELRENLNQKISEQTKVRY